MGFSFPVLVIIIFLHCCTAERGSVDLAAWAIRRTNALDNLYIEMKVGSESAPAKMLLDFARDRSTLWSARFSRENSVTASYDELAPYAPRYEWFKLGSNVYNLQVGEESSDSITELYANGLYFEVDGRFAVGPHSAVWDLWNAFKMTYGTFTLYKGSAPALSTRYACDPAAKEVLCEIQVGDSRIRFFSPNGSLVLVGDEIFARGYNVYEWKREGKAQPVLSLAAGAFKLDSGEYLLDRGPKRAPLPLVRRDPALPRNLTLMGTAIARGYEISWDKFKAEMYVRKAVQSAHIEAWRLLILLCLTLLFTLWFLLPSSTMLTMETGKAGRICLQIVTVALVIVAFVTSEDPFSSNRSSSFSSFVVWLGANGFIILLLLAEASFVYVEYIVLSERERTFGAKVYAVLDKVTLNSASLLAIWTVLHESGAVVLSVYFAFIFSLFMCMHSLLVLILIIYYGATRVWKNVPPFLRVHYALAGVLQVFYCAWLFGFAFWDDFTNLLLVDVLEFTPIAVYIGLIVELFFAHFSSSLAMAVTKNRAFEETTVYI
jgi:hypothetical protein